MRGHQSALQAKCHAREQRAPSDIFRLLFPSLKILLTPLYSNRFYAPVKKRGICFFEVTNCDLKAKERKRRTPLPTYAVTEEGIAMLSSVLNSPRAIKVNIEIRRAFVRLRKILASHADLAGKLEELEKKYDSQFKVVFEAIRQLMAAPERPPKKIGFQLKEKRSLYLATNRNR